MNFKNTKFSKPFPFVLLLQCPRSSSECVIVVQSDTCWFLITILGGGGGGGGSYNLCLLPLESCLVVQRLCGHMAL